MRLNRLGEFDAARHALRGVARRIDGYAGSDAELRELSAQLVAEASAVSAPMPEMAHKRAHFTSHNLERHRGGSGEARR